MVGGVQQLWGLQRYGYIRRAAAAIRGRRTNRNERTNQDAWVVDSINAYVSWFLFLVFSLLLSLLTD
jgi:hypothetical protein